MLIVLITVSCDKSNDGNDNLSQKTNDKSTVNLNGYEYENLGELHNESVINIVAGIDFIEDDSIENKLWSNFEEMNVDGLLLDLSISRDSFNQIALDIVYEVKSSNYDLRNASCFSNFSNDLRVSINQLFSIVDSINGNTSLQSLLYKVNKVDSIAQLTLNENDIIIYVGISDVLKGSAKLWLPTTIGGDGYIDKLFQISGSSKEPLSQRQLDIISKALLGDATGMGIGMTKLAVGAILTGGVATPALLVSACIDAALASAVSALWAYLEI